MDGAALASAGLIAKPGARVKVLAAGSVTTPLTVRVHRISEAARHAVEAAGGTVELLEVVETEPQGAAPERHGRKADTSEGAPE